MTIKGKSKPKGGGKAVTRGPKPAYVPVHKPLLQRRSFWYAVLGLVVVASITGIWYGLAKQRTADRAEQLAAAKEAAATAYQQEVEPVLAPIGQPVPPSGFDVLPELTTQLTAFIDGTIEPAALDETASAVATAAKRAAADLEAIDAVGIVGGKGLDETFVLYVLNSQDRMARAIRLYEQAALLAQDAAAADGDTATDLAGRAKDVTDIAATEFALGYQDYTEARFRAGIFQPIPVVPSP